jgi:putative restriction endonuclease
VQRRLYEARFRNAVLDAYRDRCAVCGLHVRTLLDAAHVTNDRDPKPAIDVSEGIALCATHHRAFDANILSYDNEYRIHIRVEDAALLAFDGQLLLLPSNGSLHPRPGERASRPK